MWGVSFSLLRRRPSARSSRRVFKRPGARGFREGFMCTWGFPAALGLNCPMPCEEPGRLARLRRHRSETDRAAEGDGRLLTSRCSATRLSVAFVSSRANRPRHPQARCGNISMRSSSSRRDPDGAPASDGRRSSTSSSRLGGAQRCERHSSSQTECTCFATSESRSRSRQAPRRRPLSCTALCDLTWTSWARGMGVRSSRPRSVAVPVAEAIRRRGWKRSSVSGADQADDV